MTNAMLSRLTASTVVIGLVLAAVCAILYFMDLPIFDPVTVSWLFVVALASAGTAVVAFAIKQIWDGSL